MVESYEQFIDRRPQRLCKMCGKCCRISTTELSYEELLARANNGDKEASDFLEIFKPFESVEAAMEVDRETVLNIPDYQNRTFYTCRYLDGNVCSRYLTRKEVCKRFPSTPWAIIPPKCGYEGWLFVEREKIMKHIRSLKEEQIKYKMMLKTEPELQEKLNQLIDMIDKNIKMYDKYGSELW